MSLWLLMHIQRVSDNSPYALRTLPFTLMTLSDHLLSSTACSYSYSTNLYLLSFGSSVRLFSSLSKFAGLHPGGEGVLYDATVAGKDATAVFFGLHRAAVLEKYARLIIGQVGIVECLFDISQVLTMFDFSD